MKMSITPAKTLFAIHRKNTDIVLARYPDAIIQNNDGFEKKRDEDVIYGILPCAIGTVDFSGITEYLVGNPVGA